MKEKSLPVARLEVAGATLNGKSTLWEVLTAVDKAPLEWEYMILVWIDGGVLLQCQNR